MKKTLTILYFFLSQYLQVSFSSNSLSEFRAYVKVSALISSGGVWINEDKVLTRCVFKNEMLRQSRITVHLYIEPDRAYDIEHIQCYDEYENIRRGSNLYKINDYAIVTTTERLTPLYYKQSNKFTYEIRTDWGIKRLDEDLEEYLDEYERNVEPCEILFLPTSVSNVSIYRPSFELCNVLPLKSCADYFDQLIPGNRILYPFKTSQEEKIRCFALQYGDCDDFAQEAVVVIQREIWGFLYTCFTTHGLYTSLDRKLSFIHEYGLKTNDSLMPNCIISIFIVCITTIIM